MRAKPASRRGTQGTRFFGRGQLVALTTAIVCVVAFPAFGQSGPLDPALSPTATPAPSPEPTPEGSEREMPERRTESSRTYLTKDGSLMARVFAGPVNYEATDGSWQPVDTRLSASGAEIAPRATGYQLKLPRHLSAGAVSVAENGDSISFTLRGALGGLAKVNGNRARYSSVFPDVDVDYVAQAASVKELLTLRSAKARRAFVYDLALSAGLTPRLLPSGAIVLEDSAGSDRLTVAAPWAADASGKVTDKASYALAKVESGWRLTLTVDGAWLADPARGFPVSVDPTVYPGPDRDCRLDASLPEQSLCTSTTLTAGYGGGHDHTSVLRFDVAAALPADADISEGTMVLRAESQSGTVSKQISAYAITRSWTTSASWRRHDGVNRWQAEGGDWDTSSDPKDNAKAEYNPWLGGPGGTPAWAYWDVRDIVQDWHRGRRANHGLLIKDDGTMQNNEITFSSSESTTTGNRPWIDIKYVPRFGARRGYSMETQQLSDRLSLAVNAGTGNLMIRHAGFRIAGGLGPDLSTGHVFNSLDEDTNVHGQRWLNTAASHQIYPMANGDVLWTTPTGDRAYFDKTGTNAWTAPVGYDVTMSEDTVAGKHTITENASQAKYVFRTSDGKLLEEKDRNNRTISYAYSGSQLASMTDSQGRVVNFTWTSGKITSVSHTSGPISRSYSYTYHASGLLATITDPETGVTRFDDYSYGAPWTITTPEGRITKLTYFSPGDPNQFRLKTITRVTNVPAGTGPTTSFAYRITAGGGETTVTDPSGHTTDYVFDSQRRAIQTIDALKREQFASYTSTSNVQRYFSAAASSGTTPSTSLTYDTDGNLSDTSTPIDLASSTAGNLSTATRFGTAGGLSSGIAGYKYLPGTATDEQGKVTTLGYNTGGNLTSVANTGASSTITLAYDPTSPGKLTSITDPRSNVTNYGYDTAGNLTSIDPPGTAIGTTTITPDAVSRPATVVDGMGRTRTMTYDKLDRLKSIAFVGSTVTFNYDKDGNLTSRVDSVGGTSSFTFDSLNRQTYEVHPGGRSSTYTYDASSNLSSVIDADGTIEYGYNAVNENTAVYEPGQTTPIRMAYDKQGQRTVITYPSGLKVTRTFNDAGQMLTSKADTTGAVNRQDLTYEYKSAGATPIALRSKVTDVRAGDYTTYSYDNLNRIDVAITTPIAGGLARANYNYDYDAASNRTQETVTGTAVTNRVTTYVNNAVNQVSSSTTGGVTSNFTYDGDGNETSNGAGRTSAYNNRDQATTIAGTAMGYLGAPQDERVSEGTSAFTYNVLGLRSRLSTGNDSYFVRAEDGTPLSQRRPTSHYWYLTDALGSITATTDSTQATVNTYTYEPYGTISATTGAGTNYLKFAGGIQTATGSLYHFGARYYDPTLGRWTQPDPIDQPADLHEGNRYAYVGADPVNNLDPSGLVTAPRDSCTRGRPCRSSYRFNRTRPWQRSAFQPSKQDAICGAVGTGMGLASTAFTSPVGGAGIGFAGGWICGAFYPG